MKIYFVKVTTYSSTNKLGQYIAKQASVYDHWLITDNGWETIMKKLVANYRQCKKDFPKVKKDFMFVENTTHESGNGNSSTHYCSCHPQGDEDHCAFIITTTVVKGCDISLAKILD